MATIAVLEGDQTGQELLEEALRVLDPAVIGVDLELRRFDLSLENRRATENRVVLEAADAMVACGFGIKAATVTPERPGDVGSPNAILRERVGGRVIVRTGRRIPGVAPLGGVSAPISVVRMAVDDAYGAREWREGSGDEEVAYRTEHVSRGTCRTVASAHSVLEITFCTLTRPCPSLLTWGGHPCESAKSRNAFGSHVSCVTRVSGVGVALPPVGAAGVPVPAAGSLVESLGSV